MPLTNNTAAFSTPERSLPTNGGEHRTFDILWLVLLLTAVCALSHRPASVIDGDLWWHLRAGDWIIAHHSVPWRDTFARYTAGEPWLDYTWLFDWTLSHIFKFAGLPGVVALTGALVAACVVSLFQLVSERLSQGYSLCLAALYLVAIVPLTTPRPWLVSMLLFTLELRLLLKACKEHRAWLLTWLIPLFALWANIHIQFVYGLGLLGLFCIYASLPKSWRSGEERSLRPRWWWVALAIAAASTLLTPYGVRIYEVVYAYAFDKAGLSVIAEMQPLSLSAVTDWTAIALLCMAIGAMAWTRRFPPLLCSLLLAGCWFGFHKERDVWFLAIAASAVTAEALSEYGNPNPLKWRHLASAVLITACIYAIQIHWGEFSPVKMQQAIQESLPVDASLFIAEHKLPDPLFNTFDWGGYIMWRLPERLVSIDGRSQLYGTDGLVRFVSTQNGAPTWKSNPDLQKANTVLIARESPLASLLRLDPDFKLAYEDKIAVVFTRKR